MATYRQLAPEPALAEHVACVWYETLGQDEPAREAHELRDAQPELAAVWDAATSRRLVESGAAGSVDAMLTALQAEVAARLQTARRDRSASTIVEWARRRAP